MKAIELTEEQKSKLLEMCNKLFPEYNEIVLTKQKFLNFGFKDHGSHTSRIGNMSIHWFEFCFIHIFPKLNQFYNAHQTSYFLYISIGYSKGLKSNEMNKFIHPVDYLYEEFKKLKA